MQLLPLSEIFNYKIFRIPDFQRGYSWQKEQLEDFWEDLKILGDDKIHYTGKLTIEKVPDDKVSEWKEDLWRIGDFKFYYVIDGQQRLTTSIILINLILDNFNDGELINKTKKINHIERFIHGEYDYYKSYLFGYDTNCGDSLYFQECTLATTSTQVDERMYKDNWTLYTKNLKNARDFFVNKIKKDFFDEENNQIDKKELENIFRKLTMKFQYELSEVINNDINIYVTFETINNRGKKLSNLELLKNRLIYLTTLLDNEVQGKILRKKVNSAWKTIYIYLGKNDIKPLDDDNFLYNHWIMYFKYTKESAEPYKQFLLHEKFTAKNLIEGKNGEKLKYKEMDDYIQSLSDSIKVWYEIHSPQNDNPQKEWLAKLNRLGFNSFEPLLMAIFLKEQSDNVLKLEAVKSIEYFIFTVFKLSRRQSNNKSNELYRLAHSYYSGKDEDGVPHNFSTVIQKINDIRENLTKNAKEAFSAYIAEKFDEKGFYDWDGIKYFLYEYELYLQSKATVQGKATAKVLWEEIDKRKKEESIEHIYPQSPDEGKWNDFDNFKGKSENNILLHGLGNLLLLSISKNLSLQNSPFDNKKRDKKVNSNGEEVEIGYFNGSYSEIDVAQEQQWTEKEILERGIKMLEFMEKRWNISFGDFNAKKSLLGFDKLKSLTHDKP